MNFEALLKQMRQYLNQARGTISQSLRNANSLAHIDRMLNQINDMIGANDTFSASALNEAFTKFANESDIVARIQENIRNKRDTNRYTSADKKSMQAVITLNNKISKYRHVINGYLQAEQQLNTYKANYPAKKTVQNYAMKQMISEGIRPVYEDCQKIKIPAGKENQIQTYSNFIWLGIQNAKANAVSGSEASKPAGLYQKTLLRMVNELRNAHPKSKALFAQFMSQYEGYLLSEVTNSLQKISGGRGNLSQEELIKAIKDPAITQAAAFRSFRESLESDPLMARYIKDARNHTIKKDYAAAEKAVSSAMAPSDRYTIHALNERRAALREDIIKSGFSAISNEGKLFDVYEKLSSLDDNDASPTYKAMLTSLKTVVNKRELIDVNGQQFLKDMHDCERIARDYITTHSKKPFSSLGKKRVAAAKSMLDITRKYIDENIKRIEESNKDRIRELSKKPQKEKTIQEFIELSKLQKVITPVHTVPKLAKAVNTVSSYRKSGVGHKISNVANAITSNTIGLVGGAISELVTHQTDKKTSKSLDLTLVPGSKDEHYKDDLENGIYSDRRKVPLVWAREIPEEPIDDIEFCLEVEQAKDGSDLGSDKGKGFQEKSAFESKGNRFGHAFISLKYTQNDPLTGQPKRYKTSFGFYPDDTFNTFAQGMNTAQYGSKQVGRLQDDFGHKVSIGKTFKITPEQFNQVIDFAQNYEQGGYNMLSRNCVSFTKECIDAIKLDEAKDLYEETDLNSGSFAHNFGIGALSALGVGYGAKLIAKNEMYKLQDADAFSYQRYGQKLVSKEDLKLQDMESYNFRAKGYSPGLLGEKIRETENTPLHTNKWKGTQTFHDNIMKSPIFTMNELYHNQVDEHTPKKEAYELLTELTDQYSKKFNMICLGEQFELLKDKITSLPDFDPKLKVNKDALDKMEKFSNNLIAPMFKCLDKIDINTDSVFANFEYKFKPIDYQKKKQAYKDLVALTNAYTEGMNDIFRTTFRSDPRLNLEFGKVISFAEQIRDTVNEEYPEFVKFDHIGFDNLQMLESELDTSREALHSIYDAKFRDRSYYFAEENRNGTRKEYKNPFTMSPLEAYAAINVYGSLENAVKMDNKRIDMIPDDYIDMNKRFYATSLIDKQKLVKDLGKSMENKLQKNYVPTQEDFEMIFNKLPSNELHLSEADDRNGPKRYSNPYHASNALKGIIFEKYFGGFTRQAKAFAASMRNQEEKEILSLKQPDELSKDEEPTDEMENNKMRCESFIENKKMNMDKQMMAFVLDKVANNPEAKNAFGKMVLETAKHLYYKETHQIYNSKNPGAINALRNYRDEAEARVVRDIIGTYLEPQLDYQLIREFKGPQATDKDKLMYDRMNYQNLINDDTRLDRFENNYQSIKDIYIQYKQPQNVQRVNQQNVQRVNQQNVQRVNQSNVQRVNQQNPQRAGQQNPQRAGQQNPQRAGQQNPQRTGQQNPQRQNSRPNVNKTGKQNSIKNDNQIGQENSQQKNSKRRVAILA